jgi:hypothetical protein
MTAVGTMIENAGGIELFSDELLKEIYHNYYLILHSGHNIKADELVNLLPSTETRQLLTEILLEEEHPEEWERIAQDCIMNLQLERINRIIITKKVLMDQYERNGDASKSLEILSEIQNLVQEKQRRTTTLRKGGNGYEN